MSDISSKAQMSVQGTITVGFAASVMTKIAKRHLLLKNTGAKTAFIRLNDSADAAVTDFPLVAGGSISLDSDAGSIIYSVSAICGGADNSTLVYLGWN
jgi:hypothetical protein